MPLANLSAPPLARFQRWLPGRVLLPLGFAAALAGGVYLVSAGHGDAPRGAALSGTVPPDVVRVISSTSVNAPAAPANAAPAKEAAPAPGYVRAIAPDAVYRPTHGQGGATAHEGALSRVAGQEAHENMTMPAGVERFDDCGTGCDTRDPLVVHSSYPAGTEPTAEPAAPATAEEETLLDLPGEMFDRAVEGTSAAYDTLKDAVGGVVQRFR